MKKGFLLKQYSYPILGGVKDLYSRCTSYMGAINFLLIALMAYHTTLSPYFASRFPWMSFPLYILLLFVLLGLAMLFEYKVLMPSSIGFANIQGYRHRNLLRKDLAAIQKQLADLRKEMEKISGTREEMPTMQS